MTMQGSVKCCPECLSPDARVTPLRGAVACLTNHLQYVCGLCGRCTCIQDNAAGLYRWNFPFRTRSEAQAYLRSAQIVTSSECLVCQFKSKRGKAIYRIFASKKKQLAYLDKHPETVLLLDSTQAGDRTGLPNEPCVRRLSKKEVKAYLAEMADRR